jgi:hypothetical protein
MSDLDFVPGAHPYIMGYEPVVCDLEKRVAADDESNAGLAGVPLVLQDQQITIMKSLNSLQWAKYPVDIHNSWNTQ